MSNVIFYVGGSINPNFVLNTERGINRLVYKKIKSPERHVEYIEG